MRLTTCAAAYSQQRYRPYVDASTQNRRDQRISYAISEIDLKRFSHERVPSFFLCFRCVQIRRMWSETEIAIQLFAWSSSPARDSPTGR